MWLLPVEWVEDSSRPADGGPLSLDELMSLDKPPRIGRLGVVCERDEPSPWIDPTTQEVYEKTSGGYIAVSTSGRPFQLDVGEVAVERTRRRRASALAVRESALEKQLSALGRLLIYLRRSRREQVSAGQQRCR